MNTFPNFQSMILDTLRQFQGAELVAPSHWQGRDVSAKPDMQTYELLNHSSTVKLNYEMLQGYRDEIKPDLPWSDDHFEERVSGYPLNPGTQWAKWRLGAGADSFRDSKGQFNHSYAERIWPKYARKVPPSEVPGELPLHKRPRKGILYTYGDLDDVVRLLHREPETRQAYLPIWFPEDTGVVHRDRAPCTLGWHFINRGGELHCIYYLRSCDLTNHWRNDLYMAVRLLLWVLDELREKDPEWCNIRPGTLTTHITSFHCFRGEYHKLKGIANEHTSND